MSFADSPLEPLQQTPVRKRTLPHRWNNPRNSESLLKKICVAKRKKKVAKEKQRELFKNEVCKNK